MKKFIKVSLVIILVIIVLYITLFKIIKIQDKILVIFYKKEYNSYVEKYSEKYNVDENLVYSVIKNESKFNSNAISSSNAKGLMQIMDNTVKDIVRGMENLEYDDIDIFDPDTNIQLGINYLSQLIKKYDNIGLAVAAYNAGIGNVDNWIENKIIDKDGSNLENIPFKETNLYVRKVLRDYEIFSKI